MIVVGATKEGIIMMMVVVVVVHVRRGELLQFWLWFLFPAPCTYIIDACKIGLSPSSCIQVGLHQNCTFQSCDDHSNTTACLVPPVD